jgi:hypothetical protein
MTTRTLRADFDRAALDLETGRFPMVLATDGEASDGDILSIKGAKFAKQAPLQNAHMNEAGQTLGSVTDFQKDLSGKPAKLRAMGTIEMDGEGPNADIRRDIAFMISQGHIRGVSVRWEPLTWRWRADLPEDHPAHVNLEKEKDPRKRYGIHFDTWRVLEGSIAPIQADKQSVVGRADETEGEISAFWRREAEDLSDEPERRGFEYPDTEGFENKGEWAREALPIIEAHVRSLATQDPDTYDEAAILGAVAALIDTTWGEEERSEPEGERAEEPESDLESVEDPDGDETSVASDGDRAEEGTSTELPVTVKDAIESATRKLFPEAPSELLEKLAEEYMARHSSNSVDMHKDSDPPEIVSGTFSNPPTKDEIERAVIASRRVAETIEEENEEERETDDVMPGVVAAARVRELCQELGVTPDDVIGLAEEYRQELRDPRDEEIDALNERIRTLEAEAEERESPRVVETDDPGTSAPIRTTRQLLDALDSRYQETDDKALAMLAALRNVKHGKALEGASPRERLAVEAEKLFAERRAERAAKSGPKLDPREQLAAFDKRLDKWRSNMTRNAAEQLDKRFGQTDDGHEEVSSEFSSMLSAFEQRLEAARKRAQKQAAEELARVYGPDDSAGD